jgi:polyhydroxyalkanoate synthesis regulator phasin
MIDLIKKTVLAGIGASVTTKEKVESLLHEYVEKGKLSTQEAKSLADRIIADGKVEFEQTKQELGVRIQELLKKSNLATREELHAVEKRLAELEAKHHSGKHTH